MIHFKLRFSPLFKLNFKLLNFKFRLNISFRMFTHTTYEIKKKKHFSFTTLFYYE